MVSFHYKYQNPSLFLPVQTRAIDNYTPLWLRDSNNAGKIKQTEIMTFDILQVYH